MKRTILSILVLFLATEKVASQQFLVGAAQRNINPNGMTLYLAGGNPNRPFTEVHDSLFVKALFISDRQSDLIILSFDCIGLLYPELKKIREKVKSTFPSFPIDHIVMSSTHTHAGPDVVGIWGKDLGHSGVNENHMKLIIERASEAIDDAIKNKVKAKAFFAQGSFGEDWVKNISEPLELDREVSILQFKDQKGNNLATITNFACHPTIMDDATTMASAEHVLARIHRRMGTTRRCSVII